LSNKRKDKQKLNAMVEHEKHQKKPRITKNIPKNNKPKHTKRV